MVKIACVIKVSKKVIIVMANYCDISGIYKIIIIIKKPLGW